MVFPLFTGHLQETEFKPICPMVDEVANKLSVAEPREIENKMEKEQWRKSNAPRAKFRGAISGYDKGEGHCDREKQSTC